MQKTVLGLLVSFCLGGSALANTTDSARVTALAPPAWIEQADRKTDLVLEADISPGEQVVTGSDGKIEIRLGSGTRLRVYPDTAISFEISPEANISRISVLLKLHRGRICLETLSGSGDGHRFRLNLEELLQVTIQRYGHICASRDEDMSVIDLRDGSVQINNRVEPGLIVLSEAGIGFHMDDQGSFQLLPFSDDGEIADMNQQPFITAAQTELPARKSNLDLDIDKSVSAEANSGRQASENNKNPGTGEAVENTASGTSGYIFTVYLFSTRDEDVANQINNRFQQAGLESKILVNDNKGTIRYRIVVTGFESHQSASEFADSIVGKLGISDTWIGAEVADTNQQSFNTVSQFEQPAQGNSPDLESVEQISPAAATDMQASDVVETPETNEILEKEQSGASGYIYTVYLFSTRSEEVAHQVNERFLQAGHQTRILVNTSEETIRYRIVAPGFESHQSASEFADSIVGKLGITDTWIGKDRATALE